MPIQARQLSHAKMIERLGITTVGDGQEPLVRPSFHRFHRHRNASKVSNAKPSMALAILHPCSQLCAATPPLLRLQLETLERFSASWSNLPIRRIQSETGTDQGTTAPLRIALRAYS